MEMFYMIVLTIATIVLIILLASIGLLMNKGKKSTVFPPTSNQCPDNWALGADGVSCVVPKTGNVGSGAIAASATNAPYAVSIGGQIMFNPNNPSWSATGSSAICAKKNWANNNNISWDGVDNYNSC